MEFLKLQEALKGEPKYRLAQAEKAVFQDLADNWNSVTAFPKPLRERLQNECPLDIKAEVFESEKKDSTKVLITLNDGRLIETVLMKHARHAEAGSEGGGRNTVCVSCQVGCPMRCTFCATGMMGLTRSLTADEIVEQVLFFQRYLKPTGEHVNSIVFMGMGEPMLNYDNVMSAIRFMHRPEIFNIGARHFSISTSGILDKIKQLAEEDLDVNLAISLHASNDEVRKKLMPVAQAFPLKDLFAAIDYYLAKKKRKVMFEYLMIDGVNDLDIHAKELAKLMYGRLHVVNLIAYNPTGVYKATSQKRMGEFKDLLEKYGVEATVRYRYGRDIKGACGQLATKKAI